MIRYLNNWRKNKKTFIPYKKILINLLIPSYGTKGIRVATQIANEISHSIQYDKGYQPFSFRWQLQKWKDSTYHRFTPTIGSLNIILNHSFYLRHFSILIHNNYIRRKKKLQVYLKKPILSILMFKFDFIMIKILILTHY